jgi:serine/threonine protein kinase
LLDTEGHIKLTDFGLSKDNVQVGIFWSKKSHILQNGEKKEIFGRFFSKIFTKITA